MKILVLGNGFVGKPLAQYLNADVSTDRLHTITRDTLDPYDVVINTVAKTSIDWCEKNREESFDTNVIQAVRLARLTRGKYVFFSSACIFKSETPDQVNYEDAIPNPQCFYTYTKLMAEQLLQEARPDTLVIRPRLLISEKSHPRNTINKLLKYDKIIDCQESATIMEDMFPVLKEHIENNEMGAFNIFNEGTVSPSWIASLFGHDHETITKDELDDITFGKARRVSTILGTYMINTMPDIQERLREIRDMWHISDDTEYYNSITPSI